MSESTTEATRRGTTTTTTEATRRGTTTTTTTTTTEEERKIISMLNARNYISGIKAGDRSDKQKKELRSLQYQLKKLEKNVDKVLDKFPHLKKKAPMTAAEKMAASRKRMTQDQMEEARRAQREGMESHRRNLTQD